MVNFTTANIYGLQQNTLTCDIKNYMNPDGKINRRIPIEKLLLYIDFLKSIEIDVDDDVYIRQALNVMSK